MGKRNKIIIYSISIFIILVLIGVYFTGRKLDKYTFNKIKTSTQEQDSLIYFFDIEGNQYLKNTDKITSERSFSGNKSSFVKDFGDYSTAIIIPITKNDTAKKITVTIEFWLLPQTQNISALLVLSIIDKNDKQIYWDGFPIKGDDYTKNIWQFFQNTFEVPGNLMQIGNKLKIYLWQRDNNERKIYIDDINIIINNKKEKHKKNNTYKEDFENTQDKKISSKHLKSRFYSTYVKGKNNISTPVIIPMNTLNCNKLSSILFSFNIYSKNKNIDAVFTITIYDSLDNQVFRHGTHIKEDNFIPNVWNKYNGSINIPPELCKPNSYFKLYLLNRNDSEIFLYNIRIAFKENNYEQIYFKNFNVIRSKVIFNTALNNPNQFFSDENLLFVPHINSYYISIYKSESNTKIEQIF